MTRKTWDEVKRERADSPARRRGYERAGRTIRLAAEIHELREKRGAQPARARGASRHDPVRHRASRGRQGVPELADP